MRFAFLTILFSFVCSLSLQAQEEERVSPTFNRRHGIYKTTIPLAIYPSVAGRTIRYTLDGSTPTLESKVYKGSFAVSKTTVVRAAEQIDATTLSDVATASFIFPADVINQATDAAGNPIIPEGYPAEWGKNIETSGVAPAYYAMDRSIVNASKNEIIQGFSDLPIVSIVTDRDNFFSHEVDEEHGGIYIYTGAPIGDGVGRGWVRPISLEIMGGELKHDVTVGCGIKIHGGHSRVPEKNAKHALRLMFKTKYGSKKLYHPVFGDAGVDKYEDLILRTHHSNSWLHWDESNRQRAQYTRDLWARSIQERLGEPHSQGQMVHVFINGLYWGMYTLSERLTAEHCALHYGGKEKEYDIIKVDELEGEKVIADEGEIDAWNEMVAQVEKVSAGTNITYYGLQGKDGSGNRDESIEPLLDVENFIDYMIINFYAGNGDWDHHNWVAFRNRVNPGNGFRFFCWDSELIFVGENENITTKDNAGKPSHLFQRLCKNLKFRQHFNHRVHVLMENGGLLTPTGAVEVWDSLYNKVKNAVYDESARWGVYRRDVQPYMSKGHRYYVSSYYMNERNRLLNQYFPRRTDIVLQQFRNLGLYQTSDPYAVGIDDVDSGDSFADTRVFDLSGRQCGTLDDFGRLPSHLPRGTYIVGGNKIYKP